MAFELSFVDSIATSPTTRLNLNDGVTITAMADGTDFGMPDLDRAIASTLLDHGATVPAAAYTNRLITLELNITTASLDADAAVIQSISRELDRTANFLRYKPETSNPVFFRTFRSPASRVWFDKIQQRHYATVLAEPFAYGEKQTLSNATVTNDPAAGSNGQFFDVTGVKGDIETPLHFSIPAFTTQPKAVVAVRRRGTPSVAPSFIQCESMTLSADTTLPGNDTAMSGAGSNYARCAFTTSTTYIDRAITTVAAWATASVDVRGTYRVFLRYRKSSSTAVMRVGLNLYSNGGSYSNTPVTLPTDAAANLIRYADLGLVTFPSGADPVYDGPSGVELAANTFSIAVAASRDSGTGTLDFDFIRLVPADDRLAIINWPSASGPNAYILDSTGNRVYSMLSGAIYSDPPASLAGGTPLVSPAVTNRVHYMPSLTTNYTSNDDKTTTVVVTPYYWPRYLTVARPVSS